VGNVEKNSAALNNPDVSHNAKVVEGGGVLEDNGVLTGDKKAGDVEWSKVDGNPLVGLVVPSPGEMVQARRDICYQLAVDQDAQLTDAVVKIIQVEAVEGQQHRPAGLRPHVH